MSIRILKDYQRQKQDTSSDSLFYSQPRYVHHLDSGFRNRLTNLYREIIPKDSIVLDLMSSWVSHLPEEIKFKRVIGHGMNQLELERNSRLDSFWIQDFNEKQTLPLEDKSVDICLMVAAWQYLQEPELLSMEIKRVLRSSGTLIISFSNRAFWSKSPQIWRDGNYIDHFKYISDVLIAQGWKETRNIIESNYSNGLLDIFISKPDPFYCAIAKPFASND